MTAREQFWSSTDLPQALLHEFVDTSFVLRLTCRAMRDVHRPSPVDPPPKSRTIIYWGTNIAKVKTETWVADIARSVSRVAWAHAAEFVPLHVLVRCAASIGALPALVWIREHARYCFISDHDACYYAAKHGHVHVLEWLWRVAHKHIPEKGHVASVAARNGRLECLKWLVKHGCDLPHRALPEVARNGHAAVVESLLCNGATDVEEALLEAARAGQTEVLEVFRRRHVPWDRKPCEEAARCGQLEALKFLCDVTFWNWHGADDDGGVTEACAMAAAKSGHVHVLEWIVSVYTDDTDTLFQYVATQAAAHNRINVLAWMLKRGLRHHVLDERVRECAVRFGQTSVSTWLRGEGGSANAAT